MPDHSSYADRIAAGEAVHRDDGKRVTLAWPLSIASARLITLAYTASLGRPQLLHVAIRGGTFHAHGMITTALVVRCSRTLGPVSFEAIPDNEVATVYVWNGWTLAGIDQAWLGNAGVCEEPAQTRTNDGDAIEHHRLSFSDGVGAPSFGNLTATVTVAEVPNERS